MDCPRCGGRVATFAVPTDLREFLPAEAETAGLCSQCLVLHPDTGTGSDSSFDALGDAFPTGEAALPMALLVGLLENLALYRREITALLERVERAGVDPLLVLDRLASDPDVQTDIDLPGRRRQLEQLL